MELFQRFLNKAGRGYGQVDKNLFGGLLPGGADSKFISTPKNPLRFSNVVRSAPFQAVRDVALEKSGLPKPEQFFIKAMTGGSRDITTMTPEELALVKGAYDAKYNTEPLSEDKLFELAKSTEMHHKEFTEKAKKEYASATKEIKNSPLGQAMFTAATTPFSFDKALEAVKMSAKAQQDYVKNSGPVVNLYGQGRNMKMAYGSLSVFPQPGGGVQIYDRWKVDKANQAFPGIEKTGLDDRVDRVADLGEGGPIPALIYNAAKKLGTYEPFDIRVNVSPQQWQNTQGQVNKQHIYETKEEQGSILNFLNNLYFKAKEKIAPSQNVSNKKLAPFTGPLPP